MLDLVRLHFSPAVYAHPSWWDGHALGADLLVRLAGDEPAQPYLSAFLRSRFASASQPVVDADGDDVARATLAVRAPSRLRALALHAGIALVSARIARVVRSSERSRLIEEIGPSSYSFALRGARFVVHRARLGVVPAGVAGVALTADAFACLGTEAVARALCGAPGVWLERVRLKLDRALVERCWCDECLPDPGYLRLFDLVSREAVLR